MYAIKALISTLPQINQARMVASGFCLWLAWDEKLSATLPQTLKDHGGIQMAQDQHQALWFFSTSDVFRGVARLQIWARLHPMPVIMQIMPGMLLVDYQLNFSLSIQEDYQGQQMTPPEGFEVWIHESMKEKVRSIPGLDLKKENIPLGLSTNAEWRLLHADQGLDYESKLKWFFALKPLGNPADKVFINNWRGFFSEIQELLQRLGLKYISSSEQHFIIFPLENLRMLKSWCRDILTLIQEVKNDDERHYWPIVMAGISQEGLNFNDDLPIRFNLDWDKLPSDFPHLRYRTAFLLADDFKLNEVLMPGEQESIDSWCNMSLNSEGDAGSSGGSIKVTLPKKITTGHHVECYYCGLRSHDTVSCPSRNMGKWNFGVWPQLARISMDKIDETLKKMDDKINRDNLMPEMESILTSKKPEGVILQAMFDINAPSQHRVLRKIWRSRGKDWPAGLTQQAPEEGEFVWTALDHIRMQDYEQADALLKQAVLKYPRSYQPRSLQGFMSLEQNDMHQAVFYWQEADRLSYTPLQQGYFSYLQARAYEVEGELNDALTLYQAAENFSPNWIDASYRQAVCLVKMGFTEQALSGFETLIHKDPHIFNRIIIDPELDRGRIHIMNALWDIWEEARIAAEEEKARVRQIADDVGQWFDEDHEFHEEAHRLVDRLVALTEVNNYVAYRQLTSGGEKLNKEIEYRVEKEVKQIDGKLENYYEELRQVQKEASWFPFPKLLRDFNRDFNFCAEKLNWIRSQHLKVAETFRQTQRYLSDIDERINMLRSRLVTLRIIRDSTLFVMILGKNFIWCELVCLGLALVTIPLIIYFGNSLKGYMIIDLIMKQKWEFQKGLVLILSITALAISVMLTAVAFERKKKKLFADDEDELTDDPPPKKKGRKTAKKKKK